MNKSLSLHTALIIVLTLSLSSCEGLKLAFQKKKPARYEVIGNKAYLKGTLGQKGYKNTKKMLEKNPQVAYIVMQDITGSVNEYYNQQTCVLIKEKGIQTIAMPGAKIEGGGVDFLISGKDPIVSDSSYLGVTSWNKGSKEASELSKDHKDHKFYTDFYDSIDIDKSFYWYRINKANSDELYWMTYDEIKEQNLANVEPADKVESFLKEPTPVTVLVGLKSYKSRYKILMDHGEKENAEQLKVDTEAENKELIASFTAKYSETNYYFFSMNDLDRIQKKDFSVLFDKDGKPVDVQRKPNSIYFLANISSTQEMALPGLILRYENYQMTPEYERTMSSVKIMERKLDNVVEAFNKEVQQMKKKLKIN